MTTMAPISVMMPIANLRRYEHSQEASHRRPMVRCVGARQGPPGRLPTKNIRLISGLGGSQPGRHR